MIGSTALGNTVAVGSAVADDVAAVLVAAVDAAPPPHDLTLPPTVLDSSSANNSWQTRSGRLN